jgi:uncharacterized membrane protein HdeD (DUF308 family)
VNNWLSKKRSYDLLKGILMILMGFALLLSPEFTLISLVRLVAALLIVKGILAGLVILFSRNGQGSASLFFELLIDLGIGLLILYNPGGTISFFVVIMAIWALLAGLLLAFSFNSLRRLGITSWGLFINSIVALTFGMVLLFEPLRGGLALATIIGAFALVFGIVNLLAVMSKSVS